jgi:hypothetical protein
MGKPTFLLHTVKSERVYILYLFPAWTFLLTNSRTLIELPLCHSTIGSVILFSYLSSDTVAKQAHKTLAYNLQ